MWKKVWTFVIFILIALAVGALSAYLTQDSMQQFEALAKPPLAPPSSVFPIVWTALFILMGTGAALIYLSGSPAKGAALTVYSAQLFVNFFWTLLFFSFQVRLFAFFWLLLLLALVITMTVKFWRIIPAAGIIQLPYCIWLVFAGYLNLAIYLLNR